MTRGSSTRFAPRSTSPRAGASTESTTLPATRLSPSSACSMAGPASSADDGIKRCGGESDTAQDARATSRELRHDPLFGCHGRQRRNVWAVREVLIKRSLNVLDDLVGGPSDVIDEPLSDRTQTHAATSSGTKPRPVHRQAVARSAPAKQAKVQVRRAADDNRDSLDAWLHPGR